MVKKFCAKKGVRLVFSSVKHPRTNGQVEAANKVALNKLKKMIEKSDFNWVDELPQVIWSYHTIPQSLTHETPFSLVYRVGAMISMEIYEPTFKETIFDENTMKIDHLAQLDMIHET